MDSFGLEVKNKSWMLLLKFSI